MRILALNCGSSSLKYAVFEGDERGASGRFERIGVPGGHETHAHAVHAALDEAGRVDAVAHRVVHGGPGLVRHARIDGAVLATLRAALPFAPLHLPAALAAIDAVTSRLQVPQVACLDTAFHHTLLAETRRLPLPAALDEAGLRRYGFHGLSFEWAVSQVGPGGRTVIAHLGNGASLCAVREGASVDTTMGLTPDGGVMMGTRTGDLDPGVLLFLLAGRTREEVARLVERESGLAGVSGETSDMKTLLESAAPDARLAVEMFCLQAAKAVAALTVTLGGLDLLVFTGGIGERAAPVRERVVQRLGFLPPFAVRVVQADEERQMARHASRLLAAARPSDPSP